LVFVMRFSRHIEEKRNDSYFLSPASLEAQGTQRKK
jgi:hypothetical protein